MAFGMQFKGSLNVQIIKMCHCGHKLLRICTTTTNLVLRPMVAKKETQTSKKKKKIKN